MLAECLTANARVDVLNLLARPRRSATQTEVDSVLGGLPPTFADLRRSRIRSSLQETMRLYPPALHRRSAGAKNCASAMRSKEGQAVIGIDIVSGMHRRMQYFADFANSIRVLLETRGKRSVAYVDSAGNG